MLLAAPKVEGRKRARRWIQSAPIPFGTVQLVRRERQGVDRQFTGAQRDLSGGLDRVGMEIDIVLRGEGGSLGERTDHTGLVVRPHQRGEGDTAAREVFPPRPEIEPAERINGLNRASYPVDS